MDSVDNQEERASKSTSEDLPAVTAEGQIAASPRSAIKLATEWADLQDCLLRRQADFENFRRRVERDAASSCSMPAWISSGTCFPCSDDFERRSRRRRRKRNMPGYRLIYQRLLEALKKQGLEPIETAGRLFDPNLHQGLDRVETTEAEDQAILQEYQRGYNFKGKLLRPSLVKVAVRS